MYYIHSVGVALAPTEITDNLLKQINPEFNLVAGVKSRRSILKSEYLIATRNSDLGLARANCELSVAALSAQASRSACLSAGLDIMKSDLMLADTLTPWQVTPSEAQRIAFELNLKITSFDIGSSGTSFPLLLQICQDWDEQVKEQQLLICAVHTPSLYIDYSNGIEGALFSDAAVTMVLGREAKGYEIIGLAVKSEKLVDPGLNFSPFHACKYSKDFFSHAAHDCISFHWPAIVTAVKSAKQITVCINDYGADVKNILSEVGCTENVIIIPAFSEYGDSLGCIAGIGMWQWSLTAVSGDVFIGFAPGCGQQHGVFAIKKM